MRTLSYLLLLLFTGTIWSCGGEDGNTAVGGEDTSATSSAFRPQDQDSIRRLYHQLMAAKTDTLPLNQIGEAGKLYPVDEAPKDTGFFIFRESLLNAVKSRDLFFLMDIIHPEIKVDFGGGSGVADFVSTWELDSPEKAKKSEVWDILQSVLQNGGVFEDGGKVFVAPYIYATWPQDADAFTDVAVTGSGVRLRSAPNLQSQTLTMVSYDIVKRLETSAMTQTIGGETHPWVKVQLPGEDGKEGYLYGKYVASSIDFRTGFKKQDNGKWRMMFLVAGD